MRFDDLGAVVNEVSPSYKSRDFSLYASVDAPEVSRCHEVFSEISLEYLPGVSGEHVTRTSSELCCDLALLGNQALGRIQL